MTEPEQGDVEAIRDSIESIAGCGDISFSSEINAEKREALAALDRLAAALERAEREPNRRRAADDALEAQTLATDLAGALARAEKAERALDEMREASEGSSMGAKLIRELRARLEELERIAAAAQVVYDGFALLPLGDDNPLTDLGVALATPHRGDER